MEKEYIEHLPLNLIDINEEQPRKDIEREALKELSESIKENGLIQPILVIPENERYKIIVGERRYRAVLLLGRETIKAQIINKDVVNSDYISLVENIQREDLTAVEEALSFERLLRKYDLTQAELASKVGKSRAYISNMLRILNLEQEILTALHKSQINLGHAKVLLSIKEKDKRYKLYLIIKEQQISVREAERLAKKLLENLEKEKAKEEDLDAFLEQAREFLIKKIQTKIDIRGNQEKGRIEINYFSKDEFERILKIFKAL